VLTLLSSLLFSQESKDIVVATESWDGATNRDGTGLYWDIIEEVYEPLGYTIIKKYKSYNKATEMVRTHNADMYLAAYKNEKTFALYPKYYFDQDVVLAIYRSDIIEDWKGQGSLKGLKVGWIRGYDYDKYLSQKVKVQEVNTRSNGMKLLKSEHLDAFLDAKEDIAPYLRKAQLDTEYFAKKIILQLKLYPAFAKNKQGEKLMKIWDKRISSLIKTQKFKEIYFHSEYTLFPY